MFLQLFQGFLLVPESVGFAIHFGGEDLVSVDVSLVGSTGDVV